MLGNTEWANLGSNREFVWIKCLEYNLVSVEERKYMSNHRSASSRPILPADDARQMYNQ